MFISQHLNWTLQAKFNLAHYWQLNFDTENWVWITPSADLWYRIWIKISKEKCCHNFQESLFTNLEGVIFQKVENFIGIAVRISYLPKLKFWIYEYYLHSHNYFASSESLIGLTLRHKSCPEARVIWPRVWLVTVRFMRKWLYFRKLSSRYHLRESFTSWRQEVVYS